MRQEGGERMKQNSDSIAKPETIQVLLYEKGGYCIRIGKITDLIADELEDLIATLLEKGIIDEDAANDPIIEKYINSVKSAQHEIFTDRKQALDRTDEWKQARGRS